MAKPPAKAILRDCAQVGETALRLDLSNQQLLERFIAQGDDTAFDGLVHRFGGVVWRVCHRLLRQEQDAEDAFQAVFLTLARKAASIRNGEAVGSWLYGVAFRTAMKARQAVWRRQNATARAPAAGAEPPACEAAELGELQRLLDEEVLRLPEKYRAPFVLCCLEGMSKSEAAQELGSKEGTISGRLARARKLLQKRLIRRGVSLSAALTAVALTQQTAAAAAPAVLLKATAAAVLSFQHGVAEAVLSPSAVALAKGYEDPIKLTSSAVVKMTLAVLLLLLGGTSLAIYLLGFFTGTEPTPVVIEPETFLPPYVALGTPVGEQVLALAFSADGKRLVTTGVQNALPGQLKFWDVATGKELSAIQRIPGVGAMAMAPDGQTLATGDNSGDITLRDPTTGTEQAKVPGHAIRVQGVAFSPDSMFLASAGFDRTAKLWNARQLKELKVFRGHTGVVTCVAFLRDGKAIVTGSQDGTAKIWDLDTGKEKLTLAGHKAGVIALAVSPDGKHLATASVDQTVRLWDAETGQETAVFKGSTDQPYFAVAFAPDGKLLAGAGRDGTIRLWNVSTKQAAGTLEKHAAAIWALAFSQDGILASGSSDRTAKLWGLGDAIELRTLVNSWAASRPVLAVAYPPDGKILAVATKDLAVHIRDAGSGDVLMVLPGHTQHPSCLAFAPDGRTLVSGSHDNTLKIWNRFTGRELRTLEGHAGAVLAVAFAPDGKLLASAGADKTIRLWDPDTGKQVAELTGHDGTVYALAFAPDGQTLASGGSDGMIKLWDLAKKTEIGALKGHKGSVRALAYASDGTLASAGEDTTVRLWEPAKGTERLTLTGHMYEVWALAFSPQGRTLVSAGQDLSVRIWDPVSGQSRGILRGHTDGVTSLAIHPSGQHLVSGSLDTLLLRCQAGKYAANYSAPAAGNKEGPIPKNTPAPSGGSDKTLNAVQEVDRKEDPPPVPEPKIKVNQQFYQSFKGHTNPIPGWNLSGPDVEKYVKFEPEGVCFTLPTGMPGPSPSVRIGTGIRAKGDFEVTFSFEILKEPEPMDAGKDQTRFTLDVFLAGPHNDVATLSRRVSSWGGRQFYAWLRKWDEASGNKKQQGKTHAAQATTGRLRIIRAGSEVFYYVSEGAEENCKFLVKYPISLEDINSFSFVALTGGPSAELDVRVTEALIRAESLSGVPVAAANFENQPDATAPKGRLAFALIFSLIFTLLSAGGLWLFLHMRQRRPAAGVSAAAADGTEAKAGTDSLVVAFACSGCGKTLRAKPELVGKQVKCPRCGTALRVPGMSEPRTQ